LGGFLRQLARSQKVDARFAHAFGNQESDAPNDEGGTEQKFVAGLHGSSGRTIIK
jgi:hypothetical protein